VDRVKRLQTISKACYYLGWLLAALATIIHVTKLDNWLADALRISGRNLLEGSLLLFIICLASEARAIAAASKSEPHQTRGQAA
jgi:hypothetical protein